ncbi:MAG: multicopper oxidase family protein [Actinotalea sp.]|nr:multicopper oxidase family protein [Actinotalea sp.]
MSRPISRREALVLGGLGTAGVVVGAWGLSRTGLPWTAADGVAVPGAPGVGAGWTEPEVLRPTDGLLRTELVAARTEVELAGRRARTLTYNGTVPGPTWRIRPGDVLEVRVVNELDAPTNLHTHGLAVSPQGNGDNPFVTIEPGEAFDYRFEIPEDHPAGVFWYHPHHHGHVADQIFGGLYGTIVVDGDDVPVARERVVMVADTSLTADGEVRSVGAREQMLGREGDLVLVNGQLAPVLSARPGERERWRVVNACTSRYLRLALPGQDVQLIGIDGGHEPEPTDVEEVLLAPGNRADLLLTTRAGTGVLRSRGHDRVGGMMMGGAGLSGPVVLATLEVAGEPAVAPEPVPARPAAADLRDRQPDARREITFTMAMGGMMRGAGGGRGPGPGGTMSVGFDGREFDPDRTDQAVALGTVEEWTIRNPTPLSHPFHLHVWPMQVVDDDGEVPTAPRWRDVVDVPAGGSVRVLVDARRHPGRSVYHCHVLDHEDAGMMATVEVG